MTKKAKLFFTIAMCAIPAALLAIGVDLILGWVEEKLTPKA